MSGLTVADFHFSENSPLFMERFVILVKAGKIVGNIYLSSFVGIMSLSHVFVGISLISLSRSFLVVAANDLSVGVSPWWYFVLGYIFELVPYAINFLPEEFGKAFS